MGGEVHPPVNLEDVEAQGAHQHGMWPRGGKWEQGDGQEMLFFPWSLSPKLWSLGCRARSPGVGSAPLGAKRGACSLCVLSSWEKVVL